MNFVTENITPAKAQEYLQTSLGNRPTSNPTVQSYADTMKKGKWMLNGMCIIFDTEGHLIDGHHRLMAVIKAGIPVKFDVARGISADAFTTYDCGRHRTLGQLLAMQGTKHYNMVASIVVANEALEKKGRLFTNNSTSAKIGRGKMTNTEKYDLYRQDAEGFDRVGVIMCRLRSQCRIVECSWAGGMYYYLTHTGGYDEDFVLAFFEALFTLDTPDIEVVNQLRKVLTKDAMAIKKMPIEARWAYIAKAWNYYAAGECPKLLKWAQTENIPALKLKSE